MKRERKGGKKGTHTNGFLNSEVFLRQWLSCGIQDRTSCSVSVPGRWEMAMKGCR